MFGEGIWKSEPSAAHEKKPCDQWSNVSFVAFLPRCLILRISRYHTTGAGKSRVLCCASHLRSNWFKSLKGPNVVKWKLKLFATSLRCFWECARLTKPRSIDLLRNIFIVGPRWSILLSNYILFAKLLYSVYTSADGAISRFFIVVKKERNLWTDMLLRYRGKQVDSIWILTR